MGEIKIKIADGLENEFRENAMKEFGYGKGSISNAAAMAIKEWVNKKPKVTHINNPVQAIRGMLKNIKKSSIDLQHETGEIRGQKYADRLKYFS